MKYCFVFVCQQGELETKALLLAASLRRFVRCDHELVVALPQPESVWGKPAPATLQLFEQLRVSNVGIENPVGPDYPIGNKLACLGIETTAEKTIFLDSDMLCMSEFRGEARFEKFEVNIKPADMATFGSEPERWRNAYSSCSLPLSAKRMSATVSGEMMPPYFNAGFVATHRKTGLAADWSACALAVDGDTSIPDKRPWLDQIALPLALAKLGLTVDCLDERYNYPAHLKPIDPDRIPLFCHYHSPAVLGREPFARALVQALAHEHPGLTALMESDTAWRSLLQPWPDRPGWAKAAARLISGSGGASGVGPSALPELIITGIPRSGTSYLCKLIAAAENTAVINEPAEIFAPLAQSAIPWGVATFYRDVRRDILGNKPVPNKLQNGEFIEDTARADGKESYLPRVSRADFLLATKNTLAYLARLPQLRRAMPGAAIVACVRHPLDTIASWKTTFPHLAAADMEAQVVGHSGDMLLTGAQRRRLEVIAATEHPGLRRALLWRHLAEIILENRHHLILLHYEDVVAQPMESLRTLFASLPSHPRLKFSRPPESSAPRHKREALDAQDLDAIRGICGQTAAELGYSLA